LLFSEGAAAAACKLIDFKVAIPRKESKWCTFMCVAHWAGNSTWLRLIDTISSTLPVQVHSLAQINYIIDIIIIDYTLGASKEKVKAGACELIFFAPHQPTPQTLVLFTFH
jgi:hypothetical protein